MRTTNGRNAGILLDLSGAFGITSFDDPGTGDTPGAGEASSGGTADATQQPTDGAQGGETGEGSPPADPDPSSPPAGQQADDQSGDDDPSRIKRLSDEAGKYRNRAKAAEDEAAKANERIAELTINNAFLYAALPIINDMDAAWKLADHELVTVDDDGNVVGMDDMIANLIKSYPYLERQTDTQPMTAGMGGEPSNRRRESKQPLSRATLEKKFPALRGR